MNNVLIVEDDQHAADALCAMIDEDGHAVSVANSLADARQQMVLHKPDLILLDLLLPDGSGLDLFDDLQLRGKAEIVLMTGHASIETSVQALRLGAVDYLIKPVSPALLSRVVARALAEPDDPPSNSAHGTSLPGGQRENAEPPGGTTEAGDERQSGGKKANGKAGAHRSADRAATTGRLMRGDSPPMRAVYSQIEKVARTSVSVLVVGESGTGKELVAQQIHQSSRRRRGPFKAMNCGAISAQLIESELFGHEKGSFTGAINRHKGIFEQADGGTLFLDEVTEMPLDLQVRLLRVLETGTFSRVGSTSTEQSDVRIIAATNRNPVEAVDSQVLREDLYYRLNVFQISLPPLRERLADIPAIVDVILSQLAERENRQLRPSAQAMAQLATYHWPGNVRELRNIIQRAAVMSDGDEIVEFQLPSATNGPSHASPEARRAPGEERSAATAPAPDGTGTTEGVHIAVGTTIAQAERLLIEATMQACDGVKEKAASQLGISVKTLYNRLRSYGQE